jgi:hypothetical protein
MPIIAHFHHIYYIGKLTFVHKRKKFKIGHIRESGRFLNNPVKRRAVF